MSNKRMAHRQGTSAFYRGFTRGIASFQIALLLYVPGARFAFAQTEPVIVEPAPVTLETGAISPEAAETAVAPVEPSPSESTTPLNTEPLSEPVVSEEQNNDGALPSSDQPPTGEEPPASAGSPPAPPYQTVQPVPASYGVRPAVDQSTGALTYRYPLAFPPGRNGMAPDLALSYNSQDRREGSPVGSGWSMPIPSIDRRNMNGIPSFFEGDYFTSSLSGELVRIAGGSAPDNFAARIDDGSMLRYTFADNTWIVKTKNGARYFFGTTPASRLYNATGNPDQPAARWLLDRMEDANGNRVNFTYFRDVNQLYPDTVSYTDTASGAGPFLITFVREFRPDSDKNVSYAYGGFRLETNYRISEIRASVSGQLVRKYAFAYAASPANGRSLLQSIAETGYDSAGRETVLPATSFAYTSDSIGFNEVTPSPFEPFELRRGFIFADVNGDAYADLVQSYRQVGEPGVIDRNVYINNRSGGFVHDPNWTPGIGEYFCIYDSSQSPYCRSDGTAVFDVNGDFRADFAISDGQRATTRLNLGNGWETSPTGSTVPSLKLTYVYRPSVAEFDGGDVAEVQNLSVNSRFNTPGNAGNRIGDLNRDGIADVVRSIGTMQTTNGLDETVFLGTGFPGAYDVESGWQFINGTNIGENAPAANAIFEHVQHKDAFLADLNGDELPDAFASGAIYRLTGHGWGSGTSIPVNPNYYYETQVADVNGDGLADLIQTECDAPEFGRSCRHSKLFRNTGSVPDLLQTITLPAGGAVAVAYKVSSSYRDAGGSILNPNLLTAVQTVERVTETDPITGVSGATQYEYAGGRYFFQNMENRRFAGFAQVTAAKPDATKTATYFNITDDGKIGKPERADILDASGALVKRNLTSWAASPLPAISESRYFTVSEKAMTLDFGTGGAYRAKAEGFTYATTTGALLEKREYGEVIVPDPLVPSFSDSGFDSRTAAYTYATDPASVLELPSTETLRDFYGSTVSQSRDYYDNLPLGQAAAGNRTKQETLTSIVAGAYTATQWTYTPTGLVLAETDPLNHTTQFAYDSFGLYPTTVTNALNQTTSYTYDYSSGQRTSVTDPNSETRTTVFDGADRPVEEWVPHPESGQPFKARSFAYTDAPAQVSVLETKYLSGGEPPVIANMYSMDLERANTQYLTAPDSSFLSIPGVLTIEAWIKLESQPAAGTDYAIVSKWDSTNQRSYAFAWNGVQLVLGVSANGVTSNAAGITPIPALETDRWYHVAVTYNGGAGETRFFLDGAQVSTPVHIPPTAIFDGTAQFEIGSQGSGANAFDGLVDEVRVWNVRRTQEEIQANKNVELPAQQNLMGAWHLNNSYDDASGNNNTLSNQNGASFSLTVPFGAVPTTPATPHTRAYFDGFGRPVQAREFAEGSGPNGVPAYHATDTKYDAHGRVWKVSLPYGSFGSSRTSIVPQENLLTTYAYDAADRVTSATKSTGAAFTSYDRWDTAVTDPNGRVKKFGRDAFGRLARVEEFVAPGANPFVTSYAYDASGNLASMTDAAGYLRSFVYDARGLRLTSEDLHHPDADTALLTYAFSYDLAGNVVQKQTPKGETIVYSYDALNRPTAEDFLGVSGTEVTYAYDTCTRGIGRRCSETNGGASKSFAYDFAGNVANEQTIVGAATYPASYSYGPSGNLRRIIHPDDSRMHYSVNAVGKVETVSWQETSSAATTTVVTDIDYAPTGAPLKLVLSNGLQETFLYNANAQYRLDQHLLVPSGSGAGENTASADLEETMSNQVFAAPSSPSLDILGDLTLEAWVKLESAPQSGGYRRVIGKWGGYRPQQAYAFGYFNNNGTYQFEFMMGNGTAVLQQRLNYALNVDAWYHLAAVYSASSGTVEVFVNGASIGTMTGFYNSFISTNADVELGSIQSTIGFDGKIDDARVWAVARTAAQINGNKNIEINVAPNLRASWHLNNNLDDSSGNNNALSNSRDQVFSSDVPFSGSGSGGEFIASRSYSYDPVGNILGVIEGQNSVSTTTASTYVYDGLDRLTQATVVVQTPQGPTQTVSNYTYGPTGNLLTSPAGVYSYDGFSGGVFVNPHAATQVGNRALGYDPNGNLTSDTGGAANVTNGWNYRNELVSTTIASGGQMSVNYGYDVSGQRISLREQSGSAVTSTDFPTTAYSKTVKPDGTVERIVSIEAAGLPIATIRTRNTDAPEIFITHTDHLRSTRLVTTEGAGLGNVNIVEETDYDPFGKITRHEQTGDFAEKKKFTSHEFDSATNYTYAKARYLDTSAGRFASQDPAFIYNPEKFLADPQQQNSYGYARNNPVKYVDPNGESATLIGAVAGGIIGGGVAMWNGGNWKSIADGALTGAMIGAVSGSVIDTGGLSIPAVGAILGTYSAANTGVDVVDLGDKALAHPKQSSKQEKIDALIDVGVDLATFGIGKFALEPIQAIGFDILTSTLDVLDQYFPEEIYKNVNDKYKTSPATGARSSSSGFSSGTITGTTNINSQNFSPGSFQSQLQQLQSQVEQLGRIINSLRR